MVPDDGTRQGPRTIHGTYQVFFIVFLAAAFLAGIGVFTRAALVVCAISFLVFMGTFVSFTQASRTHNIIFFILLILAFSPGVTNLPVWRVFGEDKSTGTAPRWPIELIKITVALVYFSAATSKLMIDIHWADGVQLRSFILENCLDGPRGELLLWLTSRKFVSCLLSVACLAFEFGFILVPFIPALTVPILLVAVTFHASTWYFLGLNFFWPVFCASYLIFFYPFREPRAVGAGPISRQA